MNRCLLGWLMGGLGSLAMVGGCGKSVTGPDTSAADTGTTTTTTQAASKLTASPMNLSDISYIYPLGHMNPPDHTTPTNHIYFYRADRNLALNVYAPASGTVTDIMHPQADDKVTIQVNSDFSYYLDHLNLAASVTVGSAVTAGQLLGTTSSIAYAVDLGVVVASATVSGLVNPARYPATILHSVPPLDYYDEPLKGQLQAKVTRSGADKNGKFDYDVAGYLVGNWFHESLAVGSSFDPAGWSKHLTFAYHPVYPTKVRIAIGGVIASAGSHDIPADATPPSSVTPASGKICYRLMYIDPNYPLSEGNQSGLMIVQMMDTQTIKVEVISPSSAFTGEFSANAQIYVR